MRNTLLFAAILGCFTVSGLFGCGPAIEAEKTGSPQEDQAAQQHMEQQYEKQAEEMKKMEEQMRRKGR